MTEIDLTAHPKEPPAASTLANRLYQEGGKSLDAAAFEQIQAELDAIQADHHLLFWSLVGLEVLSQLMVQAGDKENGDRISAFLLAQRDRYPALGAKVASLSQDRAEAIQKAAQSATGAPTLERVAPVFGKAAPKGTTRLSDLISPNQLRPPMPRKK